MKNLLFVLVGISVLIYFVIYVNNKENFDINIVIELEKKKEKKSTARGVQIGPSRPAEEIPTSYNYPEGAKISRPEYDPMVNPINTQMLRARNDDDYGVAADNGIERGS